MANEKEQYTCWRSRENELAKKDTPVWKSAALRRDNMDQLCHEWMIKDLDYEMFDLLLDREMKEYAKVMDGEEMFKLHQDQVEKIAPNFKQNLAKFTPTITSEKILNMDCMKATLEHCKIFREVEEKEMKEYGHIKFLRKKDKPPSNVPKNPDISKDFREKGACFAPPKPKQFSIYQTISKEPGTSSGWEKERKKSFSKGTSRRKRRFDVSDEDSDNEDMELEPESKFHFKSAREQYEINKSKNKNGSPQASYGSSNNSNAKKSLGARPRNACFGKFIPPNIKEQNERDCHAASRKSGSAIDMDTDLDPRLKGIEPKIIELVTNEIMDHGPPVQWDDIAGLEFAKSTIKEIVIWPMLRPDIFTGLRGPPKGILLFGPPGTGKTLIGKCIASQSGATFFSISASSLTSKWVGEGEKMVRALFAVASCHQPAVIFIDEIDSLLSQRCDSEHESSRRIKTEFLVQLDGASTSSEERILVVGATNRPQEIDEAARRRLSKRLYIPLPEADARKKIVQSLLQQQSSQLPDEEISKIISETDGYSGADMANLCREAALGPIRSLQGMDITAISKDDVRSIILEDFQKALLRVRPSVSAKDLDLFVKWNKQFGCCAY